MNNIQTEILVIGGGATGTGILRDLAMRGFKCILVEKRDLSDGTTGRYHGLLHSGGRYAVKDPQAARECIEENRILRKIMPQCIEDTGGFFVVTPWDDPEYAPRLIEGCKNAGIPVEELSTHQMLKEEPNLNPRISLCLRVPDASADSFLASELNAESARNYGAQIFTYHEVKYLISEKNRVVGAVCHDLAKDEEVQILAQMVVLAAGAWSGIISATVGIDIQIVPGKGTMISVNHRPVNTVINRCKMPSDGDILVPIHSVSVMGTTDVKVSNPDRYAIEPWEIRLMLSEGEKIIPGFSNTRILRAWAGVRPLYQETSGSYNRELSRAYVLLDHAARDGVEGLVTITSGKWTTYRMMAQVTSDLVCKKLGVDKQCKTDQEALPGSSGGYHYVGAPLSRVEAKQAYDNLICECELATYGDVITSITQKDAKTVDDIRRDIRLGMGPCQGGFCTIRAIGLLQEIRNLSSEDANNMLHDFLRERWKGLLPVLWGSQLRQERLNELIYMNVLNVNRLPGLKFTRLGPTMYAHPDEDGVEGQMQEDHPSLLQQAPRGQTISAAGLPVEVLIVGGGLSGLVSALVLSANRKKTRIITKGWGSLYWGSGCIDLLGCSPFDDVKVVSSPLKTIEELVTRFPDHPYAYVGLDTIHEALEFLKRVSREMDYPLEGTIHDNWLIPTAIGSIHPACLVPVTMTAGNVNDHDPMLIIGIEGFLDFFPGLVSSNLNSQGILSNHKTIRLASLEKHRLINGIMLARLFESEDFRDEVVRAIKPIIGRAGRIGLPAVLGVNSAAKVHEDIQEKLGCPIFEIPGIPPSIPGIRLHNHIADQISIHGGKIYDGMDVIHFEADQDELTKLYSEAASRVKPHGSKIFVLATGGILGGGLILHQNGDMRDTALKLPIRHNLERNQWFSGEFISDAGHPIFRAGIHINHEFKPIDETGQVYFNNLYAVGNLLGNADPVREISSGGIALATAYKLAKLLTKN
jgi:glycerol-3-phosphate dehydrogenase